ncbi:c(7)-type cytochrome triheme domain-containing protein [uncultured Paludibaculum sp.]|uniref:c(7)-type cytochrome triheme domain-containing protein n=1 Tax=uncultured Paludibaculum sp. TaxID=1765020 RepID=UPI002AAB0EF1|nr:c(7)-type cytochrome triheme domain-containing protein [uncultured Paludibaculum sp.]
MRHSFYCFALFSLLGAAALLGQDKTPPAKLVLKAKTGNVTYDHAAHAKREKNACPVCHPKLFTQDAKAPVAFKPPHKKHEDAKASCGSCHRAGGTAFETKGNCTNSKCHVKATERKG